MNNNIDYKEIVNYLIVGGLTTAVSLAVYYACVMTFLDPHVAWQLQLANVISWIASVTFAYFTNKKYVFKSNDPNILYEGMKFFASRLGTLLMDMGSMFLLVTVLGLNDKVSKLVVQFLVIVFNYIFSKVFVFGKKTANDDINNGDII